jgi:hypothetical protein
VKKILIEIGAWLFVLLVLGAVGVGVSNLFCKPKPKPPQVTPIGIFNPGTGSWSLPQPATHSESSAVVYALRKRVSELETQNRGLNAEVESLSAIHAGVVVDTVLKAYLDSLWPMLAVKVTPSRIVWTGYKDGVLTDGMAKYHAHRVTITADKYGRVIVKQPKVELGYLIHLGATTRPDSLRPKLDAAAYLTLIRGQLSIGAGIGYTTSLDVRAMIEVRSY